MACEYEAAGYYSQGELKFKQCERVEAELAGKKWRSHRAVAKELKVGEQVYVRDTTGPLAGYIRVITLISEDRVSVSRAAITEI